MPNDQMPTVASPNYRQRVQSVRDSARDHLKALRAERVQKRAKRLAQSLEPPSVPPNEREAAAEVRLSPAMRALLSEFAENTADNHEPAQVSRAPAEQADDSLEGFSDTIDQAAQPPCPEMPAPAEVEAGSFTPPMPSEDDVPPQDTPSAELMQAECGEAPPESVEAEIPPEPDAPRQAGAPLSIAPTAEDSDTQNTANAALNDLRLLPGAGVGLIWILGNCGIHSLKDLAHADQAQLQQDLGIVGTLLDLSTWITFAQHHGTPPEGS